MITALIIIGIITLCWMGMMFYIDVNKEASFGDGVFFGSFLSLLVTIEIALLTSILKDSEPTPMDVYQNKTTLEITYRDSIPVDSIVVFKGGFKE